MGKDQFQERDVQRQQEPVHITAPEEQIHRTVDFQQQQQASALAFQTAMREGTLSAPLTRHLDRQVDVVRTAPAPQMEESKLGYKEKKRQNKELSAEHQALQSMAKKNQPFDAAQLSRIRELRESRWGREEWMRSKKHGSTQQELYDRASSGDYSAFEDLDVVLRNELAIRYISDPANSPDRFLTPEGRAELEQNPSLAMHPLLRLGISLKMREEPEKMLRLDTACGSAIMLSTLTKQTTVEELIQADPTYTREKAQADIERNLASQIFIAKNLLLAHMSNLRRIDEKDEAPWDLDVSALFTHCSRVNYIMPAMKNKHSHEGMWKALRELDSRTVPGDKMSGKSGNTAGIFRRGGSTHNFKRRNVAGGGFKEKKVLVNIFGQEGMNVAIGGLAAKGVAGAGGVERPILSDGSCGHIYMMMKHGDAEHNGGYLIGFESDAHKKTNQLGHTHGLGNGEYASSFGGQRVDEIGNKYGGRVVDLSRFNEDEIRESLLRLEHYLRRTADTTDVMRTLVGPRMDANTLALFMSKII